MIRKRFDDGTVENLKQIKWWNWNEEKIKEYAAYFSDPNEFMFVISMDSLRDWGYAKDYVECMWLIMQQDKPEDFVIATGVQHTVRDFTEKAFAANGMGLKDVIVSASPEGILVSDKEQSSYIKPYVNTLDHRVMFAEKSWGSFKVIDIDNASMTIKVTLNAGHRMNYHSHQYRDEVWTVIAGKGKTIVDGMEQNVKAGDVITMSAGCRHTVIAETELKLIEVQLGEAIDVHDKQKFELEY